MRPLRVTAHGELVHRSIPSLPVLPLPKEGLRAADAQELVGELYLADISVPPGLYSGPGIGLTVGSIFAQEEIIRLTDK